MQNNQSGFSIRPATEGDTGTLFALIEKLAGYEKRLDELKATPEALHTWLFGRKEVFALLGEEAGAAAGYAIYYPVFSSFAGSGRLYVEDVFVLQEHRGKGYGKKLLAAVAGAAQSGGYGSLQWSCLDWNEPSIRFYEMLGAHRKPGSVGYLLDGDALDKLREENILE